MTDQTLLLFGCAISFIALAGAYVGLRQRFLFRDESPDRDAAAGSPVPVPVRAVSRRASVRVRV